MKLDMPRECIVRKITISQPPDTEQDRDSYEQELIIELFDGFARLQTNGWSIDDPKKFAELLKQLISWNDLSETCPERQ